MSTFSEAHHHATITMKIAYILLILNLLCIQSLSGIIRIAGTAPDKDQFVDILNGYSEGGSWSLNVNSELVFGGLPTNSFAFYIFSFNEQPDTNVTIEVGRKVPGVLLGAFQGGGVQAIDLDDVLTLPVSSPDQLTQGSVIIHEFAEVFQSELNALAYSPSHDWALTIENSYFRSIFSLIERRTGSSTAINNGNGFYEIRIPVIIDGTNGTIRLELVCNDLTGQGGYVDFGGTSTFSPECDIPKTLTN